MYIIQQLRRTEHVASERNTQIALNKLTHGPEDEHAQEVRHEDGQRLHGEVFAHVRLQVAIRKPPREEAHGQRQEINPEQYDAEDLDHGLKVVKDPLNEISLLWLHILNDNDSHHVEVRDQLEQKHDDVLYLEVVKHVHADHVDARVKHNECAVDDDHNRSNGFIDGADEWVARTVLVRAEY